MGSKMTKRITLLFTLMFSVITSVFLVYGIANTSRQEAPLSNQDKQNAIEVKTLDLGDAGINKCWQKFSYQFELNSIEDLSLDIADSSNQHIK